MELISVYEYELLLDEPRFHTNSTLFLCLQIGVLNEIEVDVLMTQYSLNIFQIIYPNYLPYKSYFNAKIL